MKTKFADLLPPLSTDEFEALKASVKTDGVRIPIFVDEDGNILDGQNRNKIDPKAPRKVIRGLTEAEKKAFIFQQNFARRNLSPDQKKEVLKKMKAVALELKQEGKTQKQIGTLLGVARETVRDWLGHNGGSANMSPPDSRVHVPVIEHPTIAKRSKAGEKREQIAADYGVSERQVSRIVTKETRQAEAKKKAKGKEKLSGTYRIIYADPPWQYGSKGMPEYGPAESHYPTMSLSELCALPVKSIAQKNAVLFLWVTSPMLEDAFEVIRAWGFQYKTSFVWDKVKHNFGHYNSVRHEFLLVCTRGSCTPDEKKLYDSVQVIERTSKHSEKPKQFRSIIDKLYPKGKRIELFARQAAKGWKTWGNQMETA